MMGLSEHGPIISWGLAIVMNRKLLEEVECFKYLGMHVAVDGGIDVEVKFRINEMEKVWGVMKRVFRYGSFGVNVKKRLY